MKSTPGPRNRLSSELPKKTARRRLAPPTVAPPRCCDDKVRTMSEIDTQLRRAVPLGHRLQRLVVQPKLTLGPVGDSYEQEADRVAREVMTRISSPEPAVAEEEATAPPQPRVGESESPGEVRRQALQLAEGGAIDPGVESSIHHARSGGQPLGERLRSPMESAFQADFSGVKVHTDATADQLNRSLQARAFTTGQDIFFRRGEYQPGSSSGQQLLAHELTHVVQQNGSAVQAPEE